MNMNDPLLRVISVSKSFGKKLVLSNVSFRLDEGEVVLLRGPNGSGKTTLLRIITGVLKPDSGQIMILGRDIHEYPSIRSEVSYCPERMGLLGDYTLMDNLVFFSKIFNFPLDSEKLNEYLEIFELDEYTNEKISALSMGTRRKVALVRSLLMKAKLYVLDEPLANLDEESKSRLVREIRALAREGSSFLVSSHIEFSGADRVLEIRGGTVVEIR